jgi:uncharacterized protein (TIGR00730 family)
MKILRRSKKQLIPDPYQLKAQSVETVAIFGYADALVRGNLYKSVFEVAKRLAEAGYMVVDGGGPGVMRAATLGAKEAGGKVLAVTLHPTDMPNFEGRDPKNIFDKEIVTHTYVERTLTMMEHGQIYVIFNGGTGTISEFGMAWGLARLHFGHHKPLILYGKFWHKIMEAFKENMLLRPEELRVFKIVEDPDQVLLAIKEFEDEINKGAHGKHLKTTKNG